MKRLLVFLYVALAATLATAQPVDDLAQQVARGVADLSRSRVRELPTGEWLRERLEVSAAAIDPPGAAAAGARTVQAQIRVFRSPPVAESVARAEGLPLQALGRRYRVELRFAPDAAWGQWVFVGGRYWILDDDGQPRLELAMFPDLLRDAPLDAPHELAWAIMSP